MDPVDLRDTPRALHALVEEALLQGLHKAMLMLVEQTQNPQLWEERLDAIYAHFVFLLHLVLEELDIQTKGKDSKIAELKERITLLEAKLGELESNPPPTKE